MEMTFTEAWNEKFREFVDGEEGVARVMEHRTIDENTEIYCLGMENKSYQVRVYSKGKGKIVGKHEKSIDAIAAYRELRDEMKPDFKSPKKATAKKATAKKATSKKATAKKATAKKATAKKATAKKAPAKKTPAKKKAVSPVDDFFSD
jgi:flagellar biosynthesis GTPase FlhF